MTVWVCLCGHVRSQHVFGSGSCGACLCEQYEQATTPFHEDFSHTIPHKHGRDISPKDLHMNALAKEAQRKYPWSNPKHPPRGWIRDSKGVVRPIGGGN